jgi:LPXTG-motif cell wall-anchored protein
MEHESSILYLIVLTNRNFRDIVHINMKKLIFAILALASLSNPVRALAGEVQIICPQAYGGGVVCGVHTPVNTGIGDNLVVIAGVLLVSSLMFLVLSKKLNKVSA